MRHWKTTVGASVLAAATAGVASTASAATALREKVSNATGVCQAALPAFDGLVRKRPLAVQNESTGHAFVTCSLTTDTIVSGGSGTEVLILYLINNWTVARRHGGDRPGASWPCRLLPAKRLRRCGRQERHGLGHRWRRLLCAR